MADLAAKRGRSNGYLLPQAATGGRPMTWACPIPNTEARCADVLTGLGEDADEPEAGVGLLLDQASDADVNNPTVLVVVPAGAAAGLAVARGPWTAAKVLAQIFTILVGGFLPLPDIAEEIEHSVLVRMQRCDRRRLGPPASPAIRNTGQGLVRDDIAVLVTAPRLSDAFVRRLSCCHYTAHARFPLELIGQAYHRSQLAAEPAAEQRRFEPGNIRNRVRAR